MNILLKNSIFTAFILTQAEASVQVKTCLLNYTLYHPGTGQCWEGLEQAVILANLVRERDFEVLKKSAKVDKVYINIYSDR